MNITRRLVVCGGYAMACFGLTACKGPSLNAVSNNRERTSMSSKRLSYLESCRHLQPTYIEPGQIPDMPPGRPSYDNEDPWGVSFFRTRVDGSIALSNLTLPRSFFGRSEINGASFENTDLSESTLCWNDFIDVNFSYAELVRADLRSSDFERCNFRMSNLREADLRRSSFRGCDFNDADMTGAIMTIEQGKKLTLSELQRTQVSWATSDGPEPSGG